MSMDSSTFEQEYKEFQHIQAQIEKDFRSISQTQCEVIQKQNKLKAAVKEQLKAHSRLVQMTKDENILKTLSENLSLLRTIEQQTLNPGGWFMSTFLGSVNSIVLSGGTSRRLEFKSEYEDFKFKVTAANIPVTIILLFFVKNWRLADQIYQLGLVYFYLTLAFRENILRVNGSNIKMWWIRHHYISIITTLAMLTWPATTTYVNFRPKFMAFALYIGVLQLVQYYYQQRRLYTLKTLGEANVLDVANSDATPGVLSRSLIILLPLIFVGHMIQFYLSWDLLKTIFAQTWDNLVEWQAYVVALGFGVMAYGNVHTTIVVLRRKLRESKKKKKAQ